MINFHLTALALSHLSAMIMTLALIGFLWRLRRKPDTAWLIACLVLIGLWLLGLFFDQTLSHTPLYWCFVISHAIYLVHIPLIQFAYHFPSPTPHLRREAQVALLLSCLVSPFVVWRALVYLVFVATGKDLGIKETFALTIILTGTLWTIVVLLRRTVYFSTRQTESKWFHALVKPQDRKAQATRAFMLAGLIPLVGVMLVFLLPGNLSGYHNTITGLLMVFVTGIVYFNAVPEESTFMVKLVLITLVTLLAVLGFVGYVVEPFYQATYPVETITDRQTFHIRPNSQGGYDIATAPFQFRDDLGADLRLGDDSLTIVELPFPFPFYDREWTAIHISSNGRVAFGSPPYSDRFWGGLQPTICPLWLDLDPSAGGGVFINQASDSVAITWNQVPRFRSEEICTVQLVLYRDGSFDFNHREIPATFHASLYALIGFRAGDSSLGIERIRFSRDLVHTSASGGVIVGGEFLGRQQYVHERLLPLALLIVVASLFVLIVFPVFFRVNLVKPLENLLEGVRRVNAGDLNVSASVGVEDEIGFLTRSFNEMVRSLQTSETNLRESETRFRTLFERAPLCIFEVDCSSATPAIVRANHQAEKTYGWSPDEFIDVPLKRIIPSQVERDRVEIIDALQSGDTIVLESISQRRNGTLFPARISAASGAVDGLGECILIVEDITVEKERRSEEEAIAEERRRIAREIHDGLAQDLASLRLRADVWHTLLDRDPARLHVELDRFQELLTENIRDVRRSIFALRPAALEELGFYPALHRFIDDFGTYHQLHIDLHISGSQDRLPSSLEPVLFRIVQEALNNVSKHAQASAVWIRLDLEPTDEIVLQVRDDGAGFDLAFLGQAFQSGHVGLKQMRERVENLQGTFLLCSQPGRGTEIQIALPLSRLM